MIDKKSFSAAPCLIFLKHVGKYFKKIKQGAAEKDLSKGVTEFIEQVSYKTITQKTISSYYSEIIKK